MLSPNGRWIRFAYDSHRISQVVDDIGRTVSYTYDAGRNLATVTDPLSGSVLRLECGTVAIDPPGIE